MLKKNIPTKEIKVGKGDDVTTVVAYQWLTQSEEAERARLITGDKKMKISVPVSNSNMSAKEKQKELEKFQKKIQEEMELEIDAGLAFRTNEFLINALCVNITYEDYEQWRPSKRAQLIEELNNIVDESTKK